MKAFSILLLMFWTSLSFAQSQGSIKGTVVENGSPLEFVNVYVTLAKDTTKIVNGSVTDQDGKFVLDKLPLTTYQLNIQMIGYTSTRMTLNLNAANPNLTLNNIAISQDVQLLNGVEVVAIRDIIKKTEEGFIVNAAENITQIGGTAADLMRNMPGILVGADGEITIRGKTPLTLINGRVSGLAGIDRAAQLEQIPASSIDRIEIINNPSSKYDADAEGGIINIILKKNQDIGTNGAFALGAGLGSRYRLNGSLLLNHKANKWNYGMAYDNWYTTRTRRVNGDRINYDLPNEYFLTQRRFDERTIFYQNARATADFAPNKYNTLNLEALWAFPGEDNGETLNNLNESNARTFTNRNQRYSNEIRRTHTVELSANYTRRFDDPDKVLNINVSDAFEDNKENTDITTQILTETINPVGSANLQRTHVYEKTNLGNVAINYAQPLAPNGIFETGYKGIARMLKSNYERSSFVNNAYVIDPLNSNVFDFNEQIHAAYVQYTSWTGDKQEPIWKYNIGLRAEQVWNTGKTVNETENFSNQYFNLFPSANVFYYTPQRNNIKLSYSRRINRPGLGQLNPFIDITDSLNQHGGNPRLKPELIHSIELGYNHSLKKASISLTGFYRLRSRAILSYSVLDANGVALAQPFNFGNSTTYGFEAIATYDLTSFWSMNFSLSGYELKINDNGTGISNDQLSWYTKLINNFKTWKDGRVQITGNYVSPVAISQGKSIAIYNVDIGVQQKIMNGKGRLGLSFTDVFNTQQSGSNIAASNFEFKRTSKLDTRAIMLTFGYTFGTSFKEKLMENRFRND